MSVLAWTETTIIADGSRLSRWERSEMEFDRGAEEFFRELIGGADAPWRWTPPHAGGRLELIAIPAPGGSRMAATWLVDGEPLVHAALLAGGPPEGDAMLLERLQADVIESARGAGEPPAARDLLAEPSRPLAATIVAEPDDPDVAGPLRLIPEMTSLLALAFFRRALGG